MVTCEASKEAGSISDDEELEIPDIAQKFDGESNFVLIIPVQSSNDFKDLFGVVLAEIGIKQLDGNGTFNICNNVIT